jgi:hypothetical protein
MGAEGRPESFRELWAMLGPDERRRALWLALNVLGCLLVLAAGLAAPFVLAVVFAR